MRSQKRPLFCKGAQKTSREERMHKETAPFRHYEIVYVSPAPPQRAIAKEQKEIYTTSRTNITQKKARCGSLNKKPR